MNRSRHSTDPAASGGAFMDEGDIGSGEKTPAQKETEEMIKEIPPLQPGSARDNSKTGGGWLGAEAIGDAIAAAMSGRIERK